MFSFLSNRENERGQFFGRDRERDTSFGVFLSMRQGLNRDDCLFSTLLPREFEVRVRFPGMAHANIMNSISQTKIISRESYRMYQGKYVFDHDISATYTLINSFTEPEMEMSLFSVS